MFVYQKVIAIYLGHGETSLDYPLVSKHGLENPKDRSAGLVRWESHLSMGDVPASHV